MASTSEIIMVTIVGVVVVFSVLVLLALIIMGFRYIFYKEPKSEEVKEMQDLPQMGKENSENIQDEELVAVIAAAIASTNPGMRFIIRNIARVPDTVPVWGRIAKQEQIYRMTGR